MVIRRKSVGWSRFEDDTRHEPHSSQELVGAFNMRDINALRTVLAENPDAARQTGFYWIKESSRRNSTSTGRLPPLSAAEAAVQMDWAEALVALHEAGDRFDDPRYIGALHMATKKRRSGCANTLLKLGASIQKNAEGLAPIARLEPGMMRFDKNRSMRSIGRGYIKAGQDPWSETGRGLAIIKLLKNGALGVAIDMLASQVRAGSKAPGNVDPREFWAGWVWGTRSVCMHDVGEVIGSHVEPWSELINLAGQVGLVPVEQDLLDFMETPIARVGELRVGARRGTNLMTGVARTGLALVQAMEDPRSGMDCLVECLAPHQHWVDPGIMAHCMASMLDTDTPGTPARRGPGARF